MHIIIASGPSLSEKDVETAREIQGKTRGRTIVVNDNYRKAPWASDIYAADPQWWDVHGDDVLAHFKGQRWTQKRALTHHPAEREAIKKYGLTAMPGMHGPGLGLACLHYGDNSGYQAINLAYLLGADEIGLLGFDFQYTGGKARWFGDHPPPLNSNPDYAVWAEKMVVLARDLKRHGVKVVNFSRETALTCFERACITDYF